MSTCGSSGRSSPSPTSCTSGGPERLRIAQPALSQQIRRTERDLGVDLFVRTSRSVALTAAGRVLQGRARSLLDQAARDVDEVVRVGRGEAGRLDVGFVVSALPLGPIERVQAFRQRYPLVRVELTEGYSSTLLARTVRGELDLAVLRDPDPDPAVRFLPFRSEPFVAAVPHGHRLAERGVDPRHRTGRRSVRVLPGDRRCGRDRTQPRARGRRRTASRGRAGGHDVGDRAPPGRSGARCDDRPGERDPRGTRHRRPAPAAGRPAPQRAGLGRPRRRRPRDPPQLHRGHRA